MAASHLGQSVLVFASPNEVGSDSRVPDVYSAFALVCFLDGFGAAGLGSAGLLCGKWLPVPGMGCLITRGPEANPSATLPH